MTRPDVHDALVMAGALGALVVTVLLCVGVIVLADRVFTALLRVMGWAL